MRTVEIGPSDWTLNAALLSPLRFRVTHLRHFEDKYIATCPIKVSAEMHSGASPGKRHNRCS